MGWIMIGIAWFVIWRAFGRGHCGWRHHRAQLGWNRMHSCEWPGPRVRHRRQHQHDRRPEPEPQPPMALTAQQKREQAMADVRRRYVADEITVEQYEAEVDRIIREA